MKLLFKKKKKECAEWKTLTCPSTQTYAGYIFHSFYHRPLCFIHWSNDSFYWMLIVFSNHLKQQILKWYLKLEINHMQSNRIRLIYPSKQDDFIHTFHFASLIITFEDLHFSEFLLDIQLFLCFATPLAKSLSILVIFHEDTEKLVWQESYKLLFTGLVLKSMADRNLKSQRWYRTKTNPSHKCGLVKVTRDENQVIR